MRIVLLFIAILPIILIGSYIYRKDKHREPKLLLLKFFLLGILSSVLLIIFYRIIPLNIEISKLNTMELFIYVFIFVAFLEELFKWSFLYKLGYNNKEFDEFYDIIVYSVFIALGFSVVENIIYIISEGQISVGIYRGLIAIPGHTCFAIFMGYYLSMAKYYSKSKKYKLESVNKLKSIFIPVILHGIYDYCCMRTSHIFIIIFFIFIINMFMFSYIKLKDTIKIDSKFK
ncbi:MAG: PrsW family intramembrane metalloprotease [Bacilli bacterium]|nr:PrsW family intramembrane metalloprotease [Bacilli bacterium]